MVKKPKKARVEAATVAPPRPDAVEPRGEDMIPSVGRPPLPEATIHVPAGILGPDDAVIISVDEAGAVEAALALAGSVLQAAQDPEWQSTAQTGEQAQAVTAGGPYMPREREGVGGRPTMFTDDLAAEICARLADGQSLREICRDDHMPARITVLRWVFLNPEFSAQYRAAREMQSEAMIDEIKDIADDSSNDWMERHNRKGEFVGWMENGDSTRRAALRINTRQWIGARMQPKKWGEKQQITHQNPDGTPVGQTAIDPRALTQGQREALADALRTAMQANAIDAEYEETT